MMISMARRSALAFLPVLLLTAASTTAQGPNADLAAVQTVYILPMASGLDQFVAHQVARQGIYQVTANPTLADAFLTDYVGTTFELRVDDLLKAAREKAEKEAEELAKKEAAALAKKEGAKNADSKDSKKDKKDEKDEEPPSEFQMAGSAARVQSFSRGKGNVFLIDAKSRRVLWTGFDIAKNTRPAELQKSAERLVSRLRKDKAGK